MVLRFGTNFLRQALRPADPLASLGFTATVRAGVRLPHRQIELEPVHRGINGVGVGVDAALGDAGGDGGGGRGDGVRGGGRGDGADGHVRAGGSASTLDLVELLNTGELMLLAWGPAIIEFPDVDEWSERIVLVTVADPDDTDCATNHRSQIADNSTVTAHPQHTHSTDHRSQITVAQPPCVRATATAGCVPDGPKSGTTWPGDSPRKVGSRWSGRIG